MTQTMQLLPLSVGLRVCISYLGSNAKTKELSMLTMQSIKMNFSLSSLKAR